MQQAFESGRTPAGGMLHQGLDILLEHRRGIAQQRLLLRQRRLAPCPLPKGTVMALGSETPIPLARGWRATTLPAKYTTTSAEYLYTSTCLPNSRSGTE